MSLSSGAARFPAGGQSYWRLSRSHRYSLLFALPLLVLYETLATLLSHGGAGVRNGADVILRNALTAVAGRHGPLLLSALLIGGSVWLIRRDGHRHGGRLRRSIFGWMMAESVLLALLFGAVVGIVTSALLGHVATFVIAPAGRLGPGTQLMVSLGAGLYEELLFRVVLVSSLAWLGRRLLGWRPWVAGGGAAITSALIFSAFHYVGPYGDPLEISSFVFRAIGGLAFSALYLLRGFGITAWTHALYDAFLLLV